MHNLRRILAQEGLKKVGNYDPSAAWAADINESGRYTAEVLTAEVPPGVTAKATDRLWEDGAPVAKKFKGKRPVPEGTHQGSVYVNDGTVYIFDGKWWYKTNRHEVQV